MNKINRQELAKAIHENAVAKGFWDEKHSPEHYLMLVITELSEAVEAWRSNKHANPEAYHKALQGGSDVGQFLKCYGQDKPLWLQAFEIFIKDTVADELADAYIRLLDLAEGFGWDVEDDLGYSQTIKDGIKERMITENIFTAIQWALDDRHDKSVADTLSHIEAIAEAEGIDLAWHITEKMAYNANRPRLHGKQC